MTTDPTAALDALATAQAEVAALETAALDELAAAKAAQDGSDEAFARLRAAMEAVEAIRTVTRADREGPTIGGDAVFTPDAPQEG